MAVHPYTVLSLCSGAGGLDLGIELAVPAARTVCYVEREAFAAATLVHRMQTGDLAPAPVWSDLATFDARPWRGRVHYVTSGDPCQGNSVAGKQLGADDARFLIGPVLRIVDECRPLRFFRENVPGNAAGQLEALVPALERMGYRVECGIFGSGETGASHGRRRFFVMADLSGGAGWVHAGQGRSDEAAPDAGGAGSRLADPGNGQLSQPGRGPQGRDGVGSTGPDLDYAKLQRCKAGRLDYACDERDEPCATGQHAQLLGHAQDDNGRREFQARAEGRGRAGFAGAGAELGDGPSARSLSGAFAGICGCEACAGARDAQPQRRSEQLVDPARLGRGEGIAEPELRRGRGAAAVTGGELADSNGENVEGRRECRDTFGWQEQARHPRLGGRGMDSLPLSAPGPNDRRWPDILEHAPELLPAYSRYSRFVAAIRDAGFAADGTSRPEAWLDPASAYALRPAIFQALAQSFLRRVPDALADRVDELRLCGNGVDPLAAAVAWLRLDARHQLARQRAAPGEAIVRAA